MLNYPHSMGVLWAFIAMLSWGIGDFLIQRSARKLGNGIALFFITAFAAIFLFPFIVQELPHLAQADYRFWLLMGASLVMLFAALFNFEALRVGKISIVEPIYALEVPLTVVLGSFFLSEWLTPLQGILILTLITGTIFVSLRSLHVLRDFRIEKGVILAFLATLGMGTANFLFGVSARHTGPLLVNWFTSTFIAIVMAGYLIHSHQLSALKNAWKKQKRLIISVSLIDNMAWIAYSISATTIPLAIATGISESYIAIAAILGIIWNREKLLTHQKFGLICTVLSAVILGFISHT